MAKELIRIKDLEKEGKKIHFMGTFADDLLEGIGETKSAIKYNLCVEKGDGDEGVKPNHFWYDTLYFVGDRYSDEFVIFISWFARHCEVINYVDYDSVILPQKGLKDETEVWITIAEE